MTFTRLQSGFWLVILLILGTCHQQLAAAVYGWQTPTRQQTSLSGRVLVAETGQPLDGAAVVVRGSAVGQGRLAISDGNGRFVIGGLAASTYTLSASKPGFVTTYFGSKRIGRGPGMPIALAANGSTEDVTIRLMRGAVIAGHVLDHLGRPQPNAIVSVIAADVTEQPTRMPVARTDGAGYYRVYGLAPGKYIVAVQPGFGFNGATPTSPTDFDRTLQAISGLGGLDRLVLNEPSPSSVGYAPTVYPGTTDLDSAVAVDLQSGQMRDGIDFVLQLVPTARLEARLVGPQGVPISALVRVIWPGHKFGLVEQTYRGIAPRSDPPVIRAGKFVREGLTPGHYTFLVEATSAKPGSASHAAPPPNGRVRQAFDLWGRADVDIAGVDIPDLVIPLRPAPRVEGHIERADDSGTIDFSSLELRLESVSAGSLFDVAPVRPSADGSFAFPAVPPGQYALKLTSPKTTFALRSITVAGRESADGLLSVVTADNATGVVLTLSDRPGGVLGSVVDSLGRPTSDYFVVIFPADTDAWIPHSQRIRSARTGDDGRYEVLSLPAGAYLVAAVTDLEPGDLTDRSFLQLLAAASIHIQIADGQRRELNLQIRR